MPTIEYHACPQLPLEVPVLYIEDGDRAVALLNERAEVCELAAALNLLVGPPEQRQRLDPLAVAG